MIRLLIFALVIALIIYMFRNHEKVRENLGWIIGTYVLVGALLIFFSVKSELETEKSAPAGVDESEQVVERGPVIGDAPVREIDTSRPVQFTRGAMPLDEFLALQCPDLKIGLPADTPRIRIGVEIKGYGKVNISRDKMATAIWYLYRMHEQLLNLENLPPFDLRLHVYKELVAYERLRQETLLAIPHDETGFSLAVDNLAVIHAQKTSDKTLSAAIHQSYHVLAQALYGKTLPWFTEGMAAYFETMVFDDKALRLPENRKWVPMMTGSYSKFNINSIPLRELLTMSSRIFFNGKKELNFAAAHSFVNFMMNHDEEGAALMQRYMQVLVNTRCERPEPAAEFFERFYPGGLANLEQRWRDHAIPGASERAFPLVP